MGVHSRTTWTTEGAYIRTIPQVVRAAVASPAGRRFNYDGFEEWWQPDSASSPQRVWHNSYTADAFLRAEHALRSSEPPGHADSPRRVIGLMFWSDSTHLTDFGQAALHPIYMALVNQDKAK